MEFCKIGYLDKFVKPTSDGGWGLPAWIISQVGNTFTNNQVYDLIQSSDLDSSIKDLNKEEVKYICENMMTTDFGEVKIGLRKDEKITYNPMESFGMNDLLDVDGTDNGDGTRTVNLDGWKPDGSQIRLGFYTVFYGDASFSQINSIAGTFTGSKGQEYDLLISCEFSPNTELRTKKFRIRFNS